MVLSLTPRIRIGCANLPPGMKRQAYYKKLNFIEACGTLADIPRALILRRWRREAPEASGFGLLISDTDAVAPSIIAAERADIARIAEAAEILRAEAVVFRTSPRITPSTENRQRLKQFFDESASARTFPLSTRVWEPQGLWEPEAAVRLSGELGIVYACDPLSSDPLAPEFDFFAGLPCHAAYFRITGIGRPQVLEDLHVDRLLALTTIYKQIWMTFGGTNGLKNAFTLKQRCDAIC